MTRRLLGAASLLAAVAAFSPNAATAARDTTAPETVVAEPRTPPLRQRFVEHLNGRSTDDASGMARVVVTFAPVTNTGNYQSDATLYDCDAARLSCAWFTPLPPVPGQYRVTIVAIDAAGNRGTTVIPAALIA